MDTELHSDDDDKEAEASVGLVSPKTLARQLQDTDERLRRSCCAFEGPDMRFSPPPGTLREDIPGGFMWEDGGGTARGGVSGHEAPPPSAIVSEEEFEWMERQRPLQATPEDLCLDYGNGDAAAMLFAFRSAGLEHLVGTLKWPGVGSRWKQFLTFCSTTLQRSSTGKSGGGSDPIASPSQALRCFGRHLGRVVTYRALALDEAALQTILGANCIFPSGQLAVSAGTLANVVRDKGVRAICVARLFIAHMDELIGNHDPSVSLHDDWQTTSLIASDYASFGAGKNRSKNVFLFEVSVPKVETIGWTLRQVELDHTPHVLPSLGRYDDSTGGDTASSYWFKFSAPARPEGMWFDGALQRTERYVLFGVPFLSQRLRRLFSFSSMEELAAAIGPFADEQDRVHGATSGTSGDTAAQKRQKCTLAGAGRPTDGSG